MRAKPLPARLSSLASPALSVEAAVCRVAGCSSPLRSQPAAAEAGSRIQLFSPSSSQDFFSVAALGRRGLSSNARSHPHYRPGSVVVTKHGVRGGFEEHPAARGEHGHPGRADGDNTVLAPSAASVLLGSRLTLKALPGPNPRCRKDRQLPRDSTGCLSGLSLRATPPGAAMGGHVGEGSLHPWR